MDDYLLHPNSPSFEPPLYYHDVGPFKGLHKVGAFVKRAFYGDDLGERAHAHKILDCIINACTEQENVIETLQLENEVLEEYLLEVMDDNKRLQIAYRKAVERLVFYEPVEFGDVKVAQTEGHSSTLENTKGNPTVCQGAKTESTIVDGVSLHKPDGKINAMHTPTISSETGSGIEHATGRQPMPCCFIPVIFPVI